MPIRPERGRTLFYHRDSEGKAEFAPPQYVAWARRRATELGVTFTGTPPQIEDMMRSGRSADGDVFLDYGISGNHLSRPGYDAMVGAALTDPTVSHVFIPRRDRLARPINPIDGVLLEFALRSAGVTLIFTDRICGPLQRGKRLDLGDTLLALIDYDVSGKFRRELAEKLLHAQLRLAEGGYSIGGEPPYGFRRWLVSADGTRVRELEPREVVKKPGCHVVWLPTAEAELKVLLRIVEMLRASPASRVARALNDEGIPSPKAGRARKRKRDGITRANSGLWHETTVRNLARHPLLVAVKEYGRRSEGDQLRFTPDGPRELGDADYGAEGKPRRVTNPASSRVVKAMAFEPLIKPEDHAALVDELDRRAETHKGKSRARGDAPNPLGGRVFDVACGWPMYRYAKRGEFRYGCALYHQSSAKRCRHNMIDGDKATRFALGCVRQVLLGPGLLAKLTAKLRQIAEAESSAGEVEKKRREKEGEVASIDAKLSVVRRNMALAASDEQFKAVSEVFDQLTRERARAQAELDQLPSQGTDLDAEVAAALSAANRLPELAESSVKASELFNELNLRMYVRFAEVERGRRRTSEPAGGVVTFGSVPSPVRLYEGPTDRESVRRMLADGGAFPSASVEDAPHGCDTGTGVGGSGNGQRVTKRCT